MKRFMLKSKIHRARLTGVELNYEGSITIDRALLEAADMLPGEQVHVGDPVIVLTYCELLDADARGFEPRIVLVDENNVVKERG